MFKRKETILCRFVSTKLENFHPNHLFIKYLETDRTEIIKKPEVIEAYLKIKSSKTDPAALRQYVAESDPDEDKKKIEHLRREKRRLQEWLKIYHFSLSFSGNAQKICKISEKQNSMKRYSRNDS